jgi:hypothetical protein
VVGIHLEFGGQDQVPGIEGRIHPIAQYRGVGNFNRFLDSGGVLHRSNNGGLY